MNNATLNIIGRLNYTFDNSPENVALEFSDKTFSYAALDRASKNISAYLLKNCQYENYIGVSAQKEFFTYAAIIGIIRAGKAYVPLNPKFPSERLNEIIKISEIKTIAVSNQKSFTDKIKQASVNFLMEENLSLADDPEKIIVGENSPAYLLFTSGSTGKPKGVSISHQQLSCYISNAEQFCKPAAGNKCSQTFELTFDLSVHDVFMCFLNGATLSIPADNELLSPSSYIKKRNISHWFSVPSVAKMMEKQRHLKQNNFPSLENILFCGEALPISIAEKMKNACSENARISNLYGPTEATISITAYEIKTPIDSENGNVCLGKIFSRNEFRIDKNETENHGELLLSGEQVIQHYFHNSEADAHSFKKDVNGKSWYCTGDIVSQDTEGNLFFVGRKDTQIKLNGYRIELTEIENVLTEFSETKNAVCFLRTVNNSLLICAALEGEQMLSGSRILEALGKKLPSYMLPQQIVYLRNFPLNNNGKTDRKKISEIVNSGNE
jgi:D-alanine--poly(phosphoribitol) ligase subunit 1